MMYTLPNKSEFNSMMDKLLNKINNSNTPEGEPLLIEDGNQFEDPSDETARCEQLPSEAEIEIAHLKQQLAEAKNCIDAQKQLINKKDDEISVLKSVHREAETRLEEAEENASEYYDKYNELLEKIPEEGTYSIPQLIEASSSFTPDEAEVILRFLQTFVANKEGNTMEQIKAAQKNLEARKSSMPASGEGFKSTIKINEKKFAKIDLIRIINALSEIGFFASTEGKTKIKTQCFITIGNALNVDLGDYNKDLTRSLQDNTKLEKHLDIFNKMAQAMTDYFNER